MSDLNIPIVRHEDSHGLLREQGQPDLIAYRPEPWRFTRLARILGAAKALAAQQMGADATRLISEAMVSIADYKGDFWIIWRGSKYRPEFDRIANSALLIEGENDIEFYVDPDC